MPREVTPEVSAQINTRISQLCLTAKSGREITAKINHEFGLKWNPYTYLRRARKAGHPWPRRPVHRLRPEQFQEMDQRLHEMCATGTAGTEIVKTINREMGLDWTLQAYFHRVKRLNLPWTYTHRPGKSNCTEYLPEDRRQACFNDPAYEARDGIADRVICRECFAILRDGAMQGGRGHPAHIHGMSLRKYHRLHPGARAFTFQRIAEQQNRELIAQGTVRRVTAEKLMADEADSYATPEELAAAAADPDYELHNQIEKYVICRVARCGFKSVGFLNNHIRKRHRQTVLEYRRGHNWPAIMSRDEAKGRRQLTQERKSKLQAELAELRTLKAQAAGNGHGQAAPESSKTRRGRQTGTLLKKTASVITLAAYWRSQGLTPYAMAPELYPANNADELENSRRSTYRAFADHGGEIEAEGVRQATLSEVELQAEIKRANQEAQAEAERKRAKRKQR